MKEKQQLTISLEKHLLVVGIGRLVTGVNEFKASTEGPDVMS